MQGGSITFFIKTWPQLNVYSATSDVNTRLPFSPSERIGTPTQTHSHRNCAAIFLSKWLMLIMFSIYICDQMMKCGMKTTYFPVFLLKTGTGSRVISDGLVDESRHCPFKTLSVQSLTCGGRTTGGLHWSLTVGVCEGFGCHAANEFDISSCYIVIVLIFLPPGGPGDQRWLSVQRGQSADHLRRHVPTV